MCTRAGIGDAVASAVGALAPICRLAVRTEPRSGPTRDLLEAHGISHRAIAEAAQSMLNVGASHAPA